MNHQSLKNISKNYKYFILLQFTKEILKNTERYKAKIEEDSLKNKVNKIIEKNFSEKRTIEIPELIPPEKLFKQKKLNFSTQYNKPLRKIKPPRRLMMPRTIPLPPTVRNIRPVPQHTQIDLKKLTPFVRDMTVTSIICNGPNENIIVRRGSEKRETNLNLTVEEMDEIVESFAHTSKIPIEDFYKVVVGNLELNAIDPKGESPRFIITKILPVREFLWPHF